MGMAWTSPLVAGLTRVWGRTWRVEDAWDPAVSPRRADRDQRYIYAMWHRTILVHAYLFRDLGVCVGVSQHEDGELAARALRSLGFHSGRGSSTRGGSRLLRDLLKFARREPGDLALTPDGPRGPAERSKPGVLYLASRLQLPLVPCAAVAAPCKVLNSWDGFLVPWPGARVVTASGEPLRIDRRASEEELQALCPELDRRIQAVEEAARRRLEGGAG